MRSSQRIRQAAVVGAGALAVGSAVWAIGAVAAVTSATPASTCRASLERVFLGGTEFPELAVANPDGSPCVADSAGVGDVFVQPADPIGLKVLYAQTQLAAPQAQAGVTKVDVPLSTLVDPNLPDISAQVLTSEASATCTNGTLSRIGKSRVVGLQVGEDGGVLPPEDENNFEVLPANPLLTITLNEQTTTAGSLTQRALHIQVAPSATGPGAEVIVAESTVGTTGTPCATTTTQPPTTPPPTTPPPTTAPVVGWMNGGGQLNADLTHSFVLPCTLEQKHPGPNLLIETTNGAKFKLTELKSVVCSMESDEGLPEHPEAGFNEIRGTGDGVCKGKPAQVTFRFTDEGEPNQGRDEATIDVTNSTAGCNTSGTGTVNGNHQAHRDNHPPA